MNTDTGVSAAHMSYFKAHISGSVLHMIRLDEHFKYS